MDECQISPLQEQRGVALIVSLLVMLNLTILSLALLTTATTEDTIAANYRNHTAAFYAAEAGLESGMVSLRTLLGATPNPTDAELAALAPPALSNPNYAFDTFQVQRVRPTPYATTIVSGPYAGLVADTTDYQITAEVRGPRGSRARLSQIFQYLEIPLFQFGVFYGRGVNLEISPGPTMTFNGRVHSNSNIYLAAGTSLKFDSFVTTTGNIYRYENMNPSSRGNNPQIKDSTGAYQALNFDHEYNQNFANPWTAQNWMSAAMAAFDGLVLDSARGSRKSSHPFLQPFTTPPIRMSLPTR
jgi:Tfp pilus assembly protein PilX